MLSKTFWPKRKIDRKFQRQCTQIDHDFCEKYVHSMCVVHKDCKLQIERTHTQTQTHRHTARAVLVERVSERLCV